MDDATLLLKFKALENKIDELTLTLKCVMLTLENTQSNIMEDEEHRKYFERLNTIAKEILQYKHADLRNDLADAECASKLMSVVKEWQKTLMYICASKSMGKKGILECAITEHDCSYEDCPKRKSFEQEILSTASK